MCKLGNQSKKSLDFLVYQGQNAFENGILRYLTKSFEEDSAHSSCLLEAPRRHCLFHLSFPEEDTRQESEILSSVSGASSAQAP